MTDIPAPTDTATADRTGAAGRERAGERRVRFRQALSRISNSSSDDLIRWVMIPASIAVIVGFNFMLFGWIGASRTFRQIEQIPYLISGGLVGLALVFLGGLMLASVFWVAVMRKLADESEARTRQQLEAIGARLDDVSLNGGRRRPLRAAPADDSKTVDQ